MIEPFIPVTIRFICQVLEFPTPPTEERVYPCRGMGMWQRNGDDYSYQPLTPAQMAAALHHPGGSTIEELARWAMTEGWFDEADAITIYDWLAKSFDMGDGSEVQLCWHAGEDIEELSVAVIDRMVELGND